MDYESVINSIVKGYKAILNEKLVGIYLHGSYVMGGFNPNISDIDFLVVVKEDIGDEDKKKLISLLLSHDKYAPAKGLEMSIMKLSDTLSPSKPTPFLLHYSNFHKEKYHSDEHYICSGEDDPDLLAHLMMIYSRGVCAYGMPIKEAVGIVPRMYYLDAIMYDLNDVRNGIVDLHEYYVLNLCRSLQFLRHGVISSKDEGGKWARVNLPVEFSHLIDEALSKYKSKDYPWLIGDLLTNEFHKYMFEEIDKFV